MQRFQVLIISICFFLFQVHRFESHPLFQVRQVEQHSSHNAVKRNIEVSRKGNCVESQSSSKIYQQLHDGRTCRVENRNEIPTFVIKLYDGSSSSSEIEIPLRGCTENARWPNLCEISNEEKRAQATLVRAINEKFCSDFVCKNEFEIPPEIRARKYAIWAGFDISRRSADHQWIQLCSTVLKENDQSQTCSKTIQGEILGVKVLTNCEIHSSTDISNVNGMTRSHDDQLQNYDYAIKFAENDDDDEATAVLKKEKIEYQQRRSTGKHRVSAQMTVKWRSQMGLSRPRECEVVLIGNVKILS